MFSSRPPSCFIKWLSLLQRYQESREGIPPSLPVLNVTQKYKQINFFPLQGFQSDWESTTTIRAGWKAMMTSACLLHFVGDCNTHLDVPSILSKLRSIVEPTFMPTLVEIFYVGRSCQVYSGSFRSKFPGISQLWKPHFRYQEPGDCYASTIVKQSKRGLNLIMVLHLIHFALNAHLSPQGLVDVLHPRRKPRPIPDSSFWPNPSAMAINDWTNKTNEPKLSFANSFMNFCIWQWNLALTFPQHNRRTGDNDVQCAFPRLKSNPQLVAMHSSISNNTLMMNTGLTFRDNTIPSNFEPVARARQQLAQHLWHQPELHHKVAGFTPTFFLYAKCIDL